MFFLSFIARLHRQIPQISLKKIGFFKVFNLLNLFALIVLLSACQSQNDQEPLASHSGFGGTGVHSGDATSGFGGTGRASSGFGGTGVIGTITQFGSIWVNGIEIGYGHQTKVTSDLIQNDILKVGQQVILETLPREDKALTKAIHIYYPLAGKVTQINQDSLMLDDVYYVLITEHTELDNELDRFEDSGGLKLKVGQFIAVNGYQTAERTWTATRISLNSGQHAFFHPKPTRGFSNEVKRVVIETTPKQYSDWERLSEMRADYAGKLHKNDRIIIEWTLHEGQAESIEVSNYGIYVRRQTLDKQIDDSMPHQKFINGAHPEIKINQPRNQSPEKNALIEPSEPFKTTLDDKHEVTQSIEENFAKDDTSKNLKETKKREFNSTIQDQKERIQQIKTLQQI